MNELILVVLFSMPIDGGEHLPVDLLPPGACEMRVSILEHYTSDTLFRCKPASKETEQLARAVRQNTITNLFGRKSRD